jgi:hypothetical protein
MWLKNLRIYFYNDYVKDNINNTETNTEALSDASKDKTKYTLKSCRQNKKKVKLSL